MADNIYQIEIMAHPLGTVVTDDGSGSDWLVFGNVVYSEDTEINLSWNYGGATNSRGFFYFPTNTGLSLTVQGLIENARGSNGSDFIIGNPVGNILYGDNAETGAGGSDTIFGDVGNDTLYGGAGHDELTGAEDDDLIYGNDGDDELIGSTGRDTLEGGAGADNLSGGANEGDTVSYRQSDAGVTIRFEWGTRVLGVGGHAQGDRLNGFQNIEGSDFDDNLSEDPLAGQQLNNIFRGYGGKDRLSLGGANDLGDGGAGNDSLFGQDGLDSLLGGDGVDQLNGGAGKDVLTGGLGADRFVFTKTTDSTVAASGRDTIVDFTRGQGDKINLASIDAQSGSGNQAFDFIGTARFTGDKGDLRYVKSGANLIVQGDINGDRRADFSILLLNEANLRAADFLL